jgi:2-polyprenyl-6-methoxyphenol hydroxylase-like FAD-dependent oxidoreductase
LNNPIGGYGLTTGITDAACLGDALVAALQGICGQEILQEYADRRRKVFLEVSNPRSIEAKRKAQSDPNDLSDADKEFYRRMNEDDEFQIDGMKGSMALQTLLDIPEAKGKPFKEVNGEIAGV